MGWGKWTNGRRWEGLVRGQTPTLGLEAGLVGGVTDEGQLQCHHDSGEGEEGGMDGWRDDSEEEAAAFTVSMSVISLQQLECFYHSKVTAAPRQTTSM